MNAEPDPFQAVRGDRANATEGSRCKGSELPKPDRWAELLAIGDLNADSLPELICALYDFKVASLLNPGYLTRPQTVHTTTVHPVSVLDNQLRLLADYTTKGIWTNIPSQGAVVSASGLILHNGFLLLADRPVIMELRPRRFPGL